MRLRSFPTSLFIPFALIFSTLAVIASPANATAPSPVIEYLASGYTANSTTWTNSGSSTTAGNGTTSTGGMSKNTGPDAVVFNGKVTPTSVNNNRVTGNMGSTTSLSHVSIEMWLYLDTAGSDQYQFGSMLFSWNEALNSNNYNVYHFGDFIGFNTFGSEVYGIDATTLKGGWHHFVFVMNDSTTSLSGQKIYVDGVIQTLKCRVGGCSATNTQRVFTDSGDFTLMDNSYSANNWNAKGKLGEARIYDREITEADAVANYDLNKATYQVGSYPPTVTLAPTAATSSSTAISFTVTGNEDLNCSTLTATDFTLTYISSITSIVQTSTKVCTINAISSATAGGVARDSTLTASGTFSIEDNSSNAFWIIICSNSFSISQRFIIGLNSFNKSANCFVA
jgi:hypothetical protein